MIWGAKVNVIVHNWVGCVCGETSIEGSEV